MIKFLKIIPFFIIFLPTISLAYLDKQTITDFGIDLCHSHDGVYLENGTESASMSEHSDGRLFPVSMFDQTGQACLNESRTLNTTTEEIEKGFVLGNGFGSRCTLKGEKNKCNGTLHSSEVKELCDSYNNKQKFTDPKAECDRRSIICEWGDPNPKDSSYQSKCFARHIPYELCEAADNLDDPDAKLAACNKAKVCRFFDANDQWLELVGWGAQDKCLAANKYNRQMACGGVNSWAAVDERKGLCSNYGCNWIEKDSAEGVSRGLTESTCQSGFYYTDPYQKADTTSDVPAFDCSGKGYFWQQPEAEDANCEDIFYKRTNKYLDEEVMVGCHYGLSCVYKPPVIMITVDEEKKIDPVKPEPQITEIQPFPTVPVDLPTTFIPITPTYTAPAITPPDFKLTMPSMPTNSCPNINNAIAELRTQIKNFIDEQNNSDNYSVRMDIIPRANMLLGNLNALEVSQSYGY